VLNILYTLAGGPLIVEISSLWVNPALVFGNIRWVAGLTTFDTVDDIQVVIDQYFVYYDNEVLKNYRES
jgi:hypothetical protein